MSKKAFKVDNSIVLRPNLEPVDPQDGEMYFDQDTSRLGIRSRGSWLNVDPLQLSFNVDQVNNFVIHDGVYWNGSSWTLARANDENTLATHVVNFISETNPNKFELCSIGRMGYGASFDVGKSVGHYYFLSDRFGANFIIKDNPLSVNVTINAITYSITGTTVATKLSNLVSAINSAGYTATGYGDVVAIETNSAINISSADNAIISVSAPSTRIGFATPVKPSFGYDNLLFFVESKSNIVYNCYRPVALGGISASSVNDLSNIDSDVLYSQNFENSKIADFIQTGLVLHAETPLKGTKSALLVHQTSVPQSFKQSFSVDRAFRGKLMKVKMLVQSTSASDRLKLTMRNETTSTDIFTDEIISHYSTAASGLSVSSGSNLLSGFLLPEPLNSLQIGCRVTGPDIPPNTFITSKNMVALTATMSNLATATNASVVASFSGLPTIAERYFTIPYSCETLSYTVTGLADPEYTESYIDNMVIELAQFEDMEVTLDVPNLGEWTQYTPVLEGFGSATSVDFKWRQVGESVEISGSFVCGTPTVDEARVELPNSLITVGAPLLTNITVVGSCSDSSSQVAIEPNVNYVFFVDYSTSSSLTRQSGSSIAATGQSMSFFASVPCAGLSATTTNILSAKQIEEQTPISGTDIDFESGKMLSSSISANTTFSFSNTQDGQVRVLVITNTSASDRSVTFPAGKWAGASPIITCFALSTTILTVVVANGTYYYAAATNLK